MSLLVDGYNLLHASGIFGRIGGARSLEHSRQALLNFIAESVEERELERTTVVFDAASAPPGLPRQLSFRGMTVRFASPKASADDEIEQLILSDSTPKRLTVVSSDHRIQRAAHRRKARAIDSDQWYAEVIRQRGERNQTPQSPQAKPSEPHTEGEVNYWLRAFGVDESSAEEPGGKSAPPSHPLSPFPPGYAEDIELDDV